MIIELILDRKNWRRQSQNYFGSFSCSGSGFSWSSIHH